MSTLREAVSTRYQGPDADATVPETLAYPQPAQVAGLLLRAVFLDLLDQDALALEAFRGELAQAVAQCEQGAWRSRA